MPPKASSSSSSSGAERLRKPVEAPWMSGYTTAFRPDSGTQADMAETTPQFSWRPGAEPPATTPLPQILVAGPPSRFRLDSHTRYAARCPLSQHDPNNKRKWIDPCRIADTPYRQPCRMTIPYRFSHHYRSLPSNCVPHKSILFMHS